MEKLLVVSCQLLVKQRKIAVRRLRGALSTTNYQLPTQGFTLIELMVVLTIVVIMSLIILVSAQKFNSAILLRSLAYEVGLSVREAQLYGVAVRQAPVVAKCAAGDPSIYCSSFGVHFSTASRTQYFIFADINNNGVYDDAVSPTETFNAQYGFTVSNLCIIDSSGGMGCASSCPTSLPPSAISCSVVSPALTSLDIAFKRPNPDAIITTNGNSLVRYPSAYVAVSAPGGATRSISISLTGQIAVTGTGN